MFLPLPEKSSYQLKKDRAWDELEQEIAECGTLFTLERLRRIWLRKAADDRWSNAFAWAAQQAFEGRKEELIAAMSVEELSLVPLKDALKMSLKMEKEKDNGTTEI